MTQMEKLEEIVRALAEAEAEATHGKTANAEWIDRNVSRALTLARELRENAVEGWAHLDDSDEPYMWEVYEESYTRGVGRPAILIVSDPTS